MRKHRLTQWCEESGKSLDYIASRAGVSTRTVYNWLAKPGSIRMRHVVLIEKATGGIVRAEHWRGRKR